MRHLRTILSLLLLLAVLTLALITALFFWITPERISARLERTLEEHLGLRVELSAPVSLKRLPSLEISIPSATLVRNGSNERVGTLDAALIRLHPWAVFARSPRIQHVLLDGLAIDLQANATDTPNSAGGPAFWNIGLVEIRNGAVTLPGTVPTVLSGLEARLEDMNETGGVIRLAGTLASSTVSGPVTLAGRISIAPGTASLQTRSSLSAVSATLDGLWQKRSLHAELQADALTPTPEGWNLSGPKLAASLPDGTTWTLSGDLVRLSGNRLDADSLSGSIRSRQAAGEISVAGSARVNASIEPAALSLADAVIDTHLTPADGEPLSGRLAGRLALSSMGDVDLELSGTLLGTALSAGIHPAPAGGENMQALTGSIHLGRVAPELLRILPPDSAWLSRLNFSGDVSVESLATMTDLAARANLSNGTLSLSSGSAKWLQGNAGFSARLTHEGMWQATLHARDVHVGDAFAGRITVLSGNAEGSIELAGRLHPEVGEALLSRADGHVLVRDGALSGFDALLARRLLLEELPETVPAEVLRPEARTAFDSLEFRTTLHEGRLVLADGRLQGRTQTEKTHPWSADLSGALHSGLLELNALFSFPPEGRIPSIRLPVAIRTAADLVPVWTPDWKKALSEAEAARADDPVTLKSLGRRVERAIRDFWQDLELPKIEMPEIPTPDWKLPDLPWRNAPETPEAPRQEAI